MARRSRPASPTRARRAPVFVVLLRRGLVVAVGLDLSAERFGPEALAHESDQRGEEDDDGEWDAQEVDSGEGEGRDEEVRAAFQRADAYAQHGLDDDCGVQETPFAEPAPTLDYLFMHDGYLPGRAAERNPAELEPEAQGLRERDAAPRARAGRAGRAGRVCHRASLSSASTASVWKRRRTELMLTKGSGRACVRLVRSMKVYSRAGSVQQLVPVKPRWPKASGGRRGPAVDSRVAASCHAKERASFKPSVMFVLKSAQVSCERSRVVAGRNCPATRKVSRAVEKRPAWPAAPPRKKAFPS